MRAPHFGPGARPVKADVFEPTLAEIGRPACLPPVRQAEIDARI
jgi:hypothetical protein